MKADYLTLSDGQKVRIMWNMNALGDFTTLTGMDMADLTDGKADVKTLRAIAWCSAREGEAADGKDMLLSEVEFGRLMDMNCIVEFSKILAMHNGNGGQKKSPEKGSQPRIFFRKKV